MASNNQVVFFLTKNNKNYLINSSYFDCLNKTFVSIDYTTIVSELTFNGGNTLTSIISPFIGSDGETYNPTDVINFSEYKINAITLQELNLLTIHYSLTNNALLKTKIKIKEEYNKANYGMCLNIASNSKLKIDYFYNTNISNSISYKSCNDIATDIVNDNFYANFKFNSSDGLITSITSYSKYKYRNMNKNDIEIHNDFNGRYFITFHNDNERVLINKMIKQSVINTIDTLGKF